jgi:basic membrane protein A
MNRIPGRVRIAALLATIPVALAACGGGDDAAGASTDDSAGGDTLRVAVLTSGPVTDKGYNEDAQRAADLIEDELGASVSVSESVPVASQSDVYRQFATQGYDLVVGWGGQFTDGALEVAESFPDTKFLVVNSSATNGTNLASVDTAIEDWQFMAGWLQAKLSTSGVVGWVGAQCFPSTAANLHGTEQGAKYANPSVEIRSTFTGDFEDPTKAAQAAQAMIESGADVLSGNLNNGFSGVYEAAENGDAQVISEWSDNHDVAPEVIVSSVLKSQAQFVLDVARSVQDDTFAAEAAMQPLPADWGPTLTDTDLLPDDLYQEALDVQEQISSGAIDVDHDETCPQ